MNHWQQIVDAHIPWLVPSVRRIVGNDHDAEDVVQEVFVEAYSLAQRTDVENWPGLLRRMSQRRAIDHLRRKARSKETASNDHLNQLPANTDTADETCEASDQENLLRGALTKLPDRQADVFTFAYFEGLSRGEIATTLEISENAVSMALHKATKRLRAALQNPQTNQED